MEQCRLSTPPADGACPCRPIPIALADGAIHQPIAHRAHHRHRDETHRIAEERHVPDGRGHQTPSVAISVHQKPSVAIRRHQWPSEHVYHIQSRDIQSRACSGTQSHSTCNQQCTQHALSMALSMALSWHSAALSMQSRALRCTYALLSSTQHALSMHSACNQGHSGARTLYAAVRSSDQRSPGTPSAPH